MIALERETGEPPERCERAWRFHALRHFAVSKLIEQGAAITLIAKVAGHGDPSITLSTYSHLMPTGAAEAADKFDPMRAARQHITRSEVAPH